MGDVTQTRPIIERTKQRVDPGVAAGPPLRGVLCIELAIRESRKREQTDEERGYRKALKDVAIWLDGDGVARWFARMGKCPECGREERSVVRKAPRIV